MLHLQIDNVLAKKVGRLNGIPKARLKSFCNNHQNLLQMVFRSKSRAGYAFLTLPDADANLRKVKKYLKEQQKYAWKHIVLLGIGGSALGSIAVRDALMNEFEKGRKLHVLDNIDPTFVSRFLSSLPLAKTLFVVISKSGTTTEPMSLYALAKEKVMAKFPNNYQKHFVFITDPKGGLLRKIAKKEDIETFDVPPKIGGRFSVLSNVGLIPCGLAGMDITVLLTGARQMREALKRNKGYDNQALKLASIQYLLDKKKGKTMTVLMPYSNYLLRIGDWYRQLLSESIGKKKSAGPTPITALGATDQHSQLQLYNDGPNNKFFIFMRVLKQIEDPKLGSILPDELSFLNEQKLSNIIDASYKGTAESLTKHKRPNLTIEVPKVDARHLGALFMLFEFEIALLGLLYNVNAFDQPGVEHSKRITKQLLNT